MTLGPLAGKLPIDMMFYQNYVHTQTCLRKITFFSEQHVCANSEIYSFLHLMHHISLLVLEAALFDKTK
jgi:hypothetical protein